MYTPSPGKAGLARALEAAKVQLRTPRASLLFMVAVEALEPESPIHDNYRDWHRTIRTDLAEWLATTRHGTAVAPSPDDEALATMLLGALIGLNLQWHVDQERVDLDHALDVLAEIIAAAVLPVTSIDEYPGLGGGSRVGSSQDYGDHGTRSSRTTSSA
jgi:hypothetical protein